MKPLILHRRIDLSLLAFLKSILLLVILCSVPGYSSTDISDTSKKGLSFKTTSRGKAPKTQKVEEPPQKEMVFRDGKLTVQYTSKPLRKVMNELSRLTGVKVSWLHPDMDQWISAGFINLPLSEAVRNILYDESYVLSYSASEEGERLAEILIISESESKEGAVLRTPAEYDGGVLYYENEQQIEEGLSMELSDYEKQRRVEAIGNLFMENKELILEELALALDNESELSGLNTEMQNALFNMIDEEINSTGPVFLPIEVIEYLAFNADEDSRIMHAIAEIDLRE